MHVFFLDLQLELGQTEAANRVLKMSLVPSLRPRNCSYRLSDAEWHHRENERRALTKALIPLPSYTEALCQASRLLRGRSQPARTTGPPLQRPRGTPLRPQTPTVPASHYYKKYIKSMYEREPLFLDYIESLPPEERNPYNMDSLIKIRSEFEDLIGDQWRNTGYDDDDAAAAASSSSSSGEERVNLYPWRNAFVRSREPASDRLRRTHAERRGERRLDLLPKLRMYHQSTWKTC